MSLSFLKFDAGLRRRDRLITVGVGVAGASASAASGGMSRRSRRLPAAFAICAVLSCAGAAAAQEPVQVERSDGAAHVVRSGDTLWDLARQYLNDPFRWPEIFSVNRDVVRDPHWIYPRDRLLIPGRAGTVLPPNGMMPEFPGLESRTVFWEAEQAAADPRTVRMTPVEELPAVEPGAFYAAALLVPRGQMGEVGELMEVVSPTVIPRRGTPQIHPYDRVLMRVSGSIAVGDRLQLLRPGREVAPYGRIYVSTGHATVLAVQAGTATIEVNGLYDRVELGDIAVPLPEFDPRIGVAAQAGGGLAGSVLAFASGEPVVATTDIAFVDLGEASGVVEGDEFVAYLPAEGASWGVRPEVEVARLQVVRAGPATSAVRVISLEQPALEAGLPVRLVARMPSAAN